MAAGRRIHGALALFEALAAEGGALVGRRSRSEDTGGLDELEDPEVVVRGEDARPFEGPADLSLLGANRSLEWIREALPRESGHLTREATMQTHVWQGWCSAQPLLPTVQQRS